MRGAVASLGACGVAMLLSSTLPSCKCSKEPSNPEGAAASASVQEGGDIWEEPVVVARGKAYSGPWRMNASKFLYVDDPAVAVAADGGFAVTWVDNERKDVFFQRYDARGRPRFEEPSEVSGTPEVFSWLPQVVVSDDSKVFVLWQEIAFTGGTHGGEALVARSTDGGRTFEEPINLSESEAGDGKGRLSAEHWHNGSLDLVRTNDGVILAAWTEYEGALWVSRSEDDGASFSEPERVGGSDEAPARGPTLARGPRGVHLAWAVGERRDADIRYARTGEDGAFGEPERALRTRGHSDAPALAVDGERTVHLVFAEGSEGRFGRHHLRYSRRGPSGFGRSRALTAEADGEGAHFPAIDVDGEGRLYVLWERMPDPHDRPFGLGFTRSVDGGDAFASPSLVPGTAEAELGVTGGLQGLLPSKLDVGAGGTIGVVHSRFDPGEQSVVRLHRGALPTR